MLNQNLLMLLNIVKYTQSENAARMLFFLGHGKDIFLARNLILYRRLTHPQKKNL